MTLANSINKVGARIFATQKPQLKRVLARAYALPHHFGMTKFRLARAARSDHRRLLEIGPGRQRIPGFETMSTLAGKHVDYRLDASAPLPFRSGTFDVIYASHVLEHIPWFLTTVALCEWRRILRPGGRLEVWVPDGRKILDAVLAEEELRPTAAVERDGWFRFNDNKDAYIWANGRIFSYGEGDAGPSDNWHRALFTEQSLRRALRDAGFTTVEPLERSAVRGHDHGWINLGVVASYGDVSDPIADDN